MVKQHNMYEHIIKESVRQLRKKGYTFKEILEEFPFLAKSTVSGWVESITLTSEQEKRILQEQLKGRRKLMEYNKKKHQEAIKNAQRIISEARKRIGKINQRDLTIAGTALYWAEGYKKSKNVIDFVNSDPKMITLMMRFFREICKIKESKFRCKLVLHPRLNKKEALEFWSFITKVPLGQFLKVYTKPPKSSTGKMHNILYKGTLQIRICDTKNLWKIKGFITTLS